MTPQQLYNLCKESIRQHDEMKMKVMPSVILTIPRNLLPRDFPKGELLNETERNNTTERTYRFDCTRVINWLIHKELIVES